MNTITLVVLLLVASTYATNSLCPGRTFPTTVSTTIGPVRGTYYNGSLAFLGVPYAKPPVGSLRFAPPVAVAKRSAPWSATQWPNSCYQAGVTSTVGYNQSEDCLYLNVFTPPCKPHAYPVAKLPVLVFIHGGRFWTGYSQQFPGDLMATEENAIVVSIQYRLNIFGFQSFDSNTNNGLKDQQLALKWVKDNIASFGGDPNTITLFGESAGASSVFYHLTMPSSYQYYKRGIIQSFWQWIIPTVAASRQNTVAWAGLAKIGCKNVTAGGAPDYPAILACLRAQPAAKINPTTGESNFMVPMVDGVLINNLPLKTIKLGNYNKRADIVFGHNYDEGNFMAFSRLGFKTPDQAVTDATYTSVLNRTILVYLDQAAADFIIAQYAPVKAQLGNWYGGAQFFGDYYITCGSVLAAKYLAAQRASFKTYIFNYTSPTYPANDWFNAASHGNELPYIFQQPIYTPYNFSFPDYVMSERMGSAWVNFAKYGDSPFSLWFADYPSATYFGPNSYGFFDTVPYQKDFCNFWQSYYELY